MAFRVGRGFGLAALGAGFLADPETAIRRALELGGQLPAEFVILVAILLQMGLGQRWLRRRLGLRRLRSLLGFALTGAAAGGMLGEDGPAR